MPAVREQILAAMASKLVGIAVPAGLIVERNRTTDVDKYPALVVLDGGHEVLSNEVQFLRYRMTVSVQGFVQSKSEQQIGSLLNELYAAVVVALTTDTTLGNLAIDTREESMAVEINADADDHVTAGFDATFSVEFATRYGNPALIAP